MAEPIDQSRATPGPEGEAGAGKTGLRPNAPTAGAYPVEFAADDPVDRDAYQPLSPLAVIGLAVALVYTAVVAIGGLICYLRGTPWLMPTWTLVLPAAGVVLSLLGWLQVQRSEGTRAGARAAIWGLRLSILVGLLYWCYVFAIYFAIRNQAEAFTNQWLGKIRDGEVLAAFRQTIEPGSRPPEGDRLRHELEMRYNVGGGREDMPGGGGGALSGFLRREPVRLLALAGPDAEIKSLGVKQWAFTRGGYQVELNYLISTPQAQFEVPITVYGWEGLGKDRQWQVFRDQSMPRLSSITMKKYGEEVLALQQRSYQFLIEIFTDLSRGQADTFYLATRPPAERNQLRNVYQVSSHLLPLLSLGSTPGGPSTCQLLTATRALVFPELSRRLYLPGYQQFVEGGLIDADPGTFWAPEQMRDEILSEVRDLFQMPDASLAASLEIPAGRVLRWERKDGKFRIFHDCNVRGLPKYQVEAEVVVECDARQADSGAPPDWQLVSLRLVRGRTAPTDPMEGPPRPGGPM